jgi:hypothetical protein
MSLEFFENTPVYWGLTTVAILKITLAEGKIVLTDILKHFFAI